MRYSARLAGVTTVAVAIWLAPTILPAGDPVYWCSGAGTPPCDPSKIDSPCYVPPPPPPPCEPKECDKCTKSPCYVGSGTYVTDVNDLSARTVGFPLLVARHYQSTLQIDGPLGKGWTSSVTPRVYYALYLYAAPSTYQKQAYIIMPTGARYTFSDNGGGPFTAPQGRHDSLVRNGDGSFDMTLQRSRSVLHFGVSGSLETMTDDYGNRLTWTFDGSGRVQTISDSAGSGRSLTVTWGPDGRIATIQDSSGRIVRYSYDGQAALSTVTDPATRVMTYGYLQGRFGPLLTRITDNWSRVISDITYDPVDRVKTYTDKGETFTYTYGYGGGSTTSKTDSQGNAFLYPFGSNGLVSDTTPPGGGGAPTHTDYYADGSIQQFIDGVGVKTYYTYTSGGSPLSITQDYQGPNAVRYDYAYDSNFPAKATSVTPSDPVTGVGNYDWQAWKYDYYQAGSAAPGALHHVYRLANDFITTQTVATYEYNSQGQVTRSTSPTGGVTDYGYDAQGNLHAMTLPANNDAGTRPIITYDYDPLGRVTSVTDALTHATTYAYDPLDRTASVTLPKPSSGSSLTFTTTYSYDHFDSSSGLLFTNLSDPNGLLTKQGYDQYGQLASVVNALTNATTYTYTKGLVTSITDANNNATTFSYDAARRLYRTTFPDGAYEQYAYTGDNLLDTKTDRKNKTINYDYDHFKRVSLKTYPGGGSIAYAYQGQKLTQVVDTSASPTEVHVFSYETYYRVASVTEASRGTINYQYNADDSLQNYAVQGGASTTYTYYPGGNLNTIVWSPVSGSFKYQYTLRGQYQSLTYPGGASRNYAYDDQGRPTQLTNLTSGSVNLATYAYGYDLDYTNSQFDRKGQRVSLTATVPSQGFSNHLFKYEYDGAYALKKVTYPNVAPFNAEVDSWSYDAIGNRLTNTVNSTTQTYTYQKIGSNPLNWQRLLADGANSYTYDNNGNTQTRTGAAFTWDYDDRMTGSTGTSSYMYDYQGRRSSRTVGSATNAYLYDGMNLIEEAGAASADYLFGPGIDEPLAMSRGGSTYYYGIDGLGSVSLVTDSTGAIQNSYIYDAWGAARIQSGILASPFGYTAREFGESSTLFYRARYYQPGSGRFESEDPDRYNGQSSNAYSYAASRPLFYKDPLGLAPRPDPPPWWQFDPGPFQRCVEAANKAHAERSTLCAQAYADCQARCKRACPRPPSLCLSCSLEFTICRDLDMFLYARNLSDCLPLLPTGPPLSQSAPVPVVPIELPL